MKTDISASAFDKMNRKTKPPGSLGVLENVAVRLADLQQTLEPKLNQKTDLYLRRHSWCDLGRCQRLPERSDRSDGVEFLKRRRRDQCIGPPRWD